MLAARRLVCGVRSLVPSLSIGRGPPDMFCKHPPLTHLKLSFGQRVLCTADGPEAVSDDSEKLLRVLELHSPLPVICDNTHHCHAAGSPPSAVDCGPYVQNVSNRDGG